MGYSERLQVLDGDKIIKEYFEIRSYSNTDCHIPYNFYHYIINKNDDNVCPIINNFEEGIQSIIVNLEEYIKYIKLIEEESKIRESKFNEETEEYEEDDYEYKYVGDIYWSLYRYTEMNEELKKIFNENKDLKLKISFRW